jgi:hypothetical protein
MQTDETKNYATGRRAFAPQHRAEDNTTSRRGERKFNSRETNFGASVNDARGAGKNCKDEG